MHEFAHTYAAAEEGMRAALIALEQAANQLGMRPHTQSKLLLIAEELYTNTLRHGSARAQGQVHIRLGRQGEHAWLRYEDEGAAYDPFAAAHADDLRDELRMPVADRPVGRLGIVLIQGLALSTQYVRAAERNCIDVVIEDTA